METTPRPTPPPAPINWRFQFQQYGTALLVTAFFFVILSIYLYYRRGYFDVYIANKVFANVSAILLGVVLLMGPLSRWFISCASQLQYRKELGIVAFLLALVHGVVSFFFLPDKFPMERFIGSWNWPFVFGLVATIVLIVLFCISFERVMKAMSLKVWWWIQNWGVRLAFVLVALHVVVMKKDGWFDWYKEGGSDELVHPEWPGAGLLIGWFLAFVLLVRLGEFGGPRVGRVVWWLSAVGLTAAYVGSFWWGAQL